MAIRRWLAAMAAALAFIIVGYVVFALRQSLKREGEIGVGEQFPALQVRVIVPESRSLQLPSNRKSLIIFFRHDCSHCAEELTRLDRACLTIEQNRLNRVAVSFGREEETRAWAVASRLKLEIGVADDSDFAARHVDWLTTVPLVFLLDERGMIRYKRAGERSEEYDADLIRTFAAAR